MSHSSTYRRVAEYVVNVLGFDGILYASSQTGSAGDDDEDLVDGVVHIGERDAETIAELNVALLGKAATVAEGSAASASGNESSEREARRGALTLDEQSVQAVVVKQVSYAHRWEFIPNPDQVRGARNTHTPESNLDFTNDDDVDF